MPSELEKELKRLERELKKELRAANPVTLVVQLALALAGIGLVGIALAGVWGAWHETTTKQTIGATTTTVATAAAWSDTLVASLLGSGLLLVFAGAFFTRITGLTLPGGLGITVAAQAKLAQSLAARAATNESLQDPVTFRAAYVRALVHYRDLSHTWAHAAPAVSRIKLGDNIDLGEMAYTRSTGVRASEAPATLADAAVDKALSDLGLE